MDKKINVGDIVVLVEENYADGFLTVLAKEKHLFEMVGWAHEVINLRSISTNIKARVYEKYIRHATLKEQYLRTGNSIVIDDIGYLVVGNEVIGLKGGFDSDYFCDDLLTVTDKRPITKVFNSSSGKFENKINVNHKTATILWERKPKIELTSDEVVILKNIDKKYKYIARDKDNNPSLMVYEKEPMKSDIYNEYLTSDNTGWEYLYVFCHLFQNITFESGAHLIADLIKELEK